MKTYLSPEIIGQRLTELRKRKGLSQDELAKQVRLSRTAIVQIEQGNRRVDVLELYHLAKVLGFSLDEFMSESFLENEKIETETRVQKATEERISVPNLNIEKFKQVLLYILRQCAGKPNVGETVLYKLLYFSDFNYYEIYEEQMTGAKYRKLSYGPVPQSVERIIELMIDTGQLQRVKSEYHGFPQTRYLPLVQPDLTLLKASEVDVIDRVLDHMGDWSAAMISDYSHGDKPWKATAMNDDLNYELAFYRRPPYSVRVYVEDDNS